VFTDYLPDIHELLGFLEYLYNLFFFESLSHMPSSWVKSNIITRRKSWAGQEDSNGHRGSGSEK
jgi:hypothetical protein